MTHEQPPLIEIATARPVEWADVARWTFDHFEPPFAHLRADRLVNVLVSGDADPRGVLVAKQAGEVVGGMVTQRQAAGMAVVLPPGGRTAAIRERLADAMVGHFSSLDVSLAQVFLNPAEEPHARVLLRHGFQPVTSLLMMSQDAVSHAPLSSRSPVRIIPFEALEPDQFANTLFDTFTDSQDVPEAAVGRSAADIVDAFRHGQPEPFNWWVALDARNQPCGVLLLAVAPGVLDVAYLGVVPVARGQGVGTALMHFAAEQAELAGLPLELSVDERNEPARRLYARFGFRSRSRQAVWLWWANGPTPTVGKVQPTPAHFPT